MKLPTLLEDESWKNMYCVYTTSMRKIVYREEESEWSVTLSRLFYHCLQVYLKWPLFPLGPIDKIKRMNGLLTLAKRLVLLCLISLFHFISFHLVSSHFISFHWIIQFVLLICLQEDAAATLLLWIFLQETINRWSLQIKSSTSSIPLAHLPKVEKSLVRYEYFAWKVNVGNQTEKRSGTNLGQHWPSKLTNRSIIVI